MHRITLRPVTLIVIAVIIIAVTGWLLSKPSGTPANRHDIDTSSTVATTSAKDTVRMPASTNERYEANTTPKTDDTNVYTDAKLGLTFEMPKGWHVTSNTLGYGVLRLANYDEEHAPPKGWRSGWNKIEMVITTDTTAITTEDYPIKNEVTNTVSVGNTIAKVDDVEFVDGAMARIYSLPIPNDAQTRLELIIWGDSSNFDVLDELVNGLRWNDNIVIPRE